MTINKSNRPASLFYAVTLLLALVSTGCYHVRKSGSPEIPAPRDPYREAVDARLQEMSQDPDVQLARPTEYYIGPGDILSVTLVGRPDILSNNRDTGERYTITVTENPLITLPMIGAIRVHGKTSIQLEEEVREAYAQYISDPNPIVTIDQYYHNQVTVLGSVRNPGRFPLDFGDTLIDSIFKAGGLTFGRETGGLAPARYLKVYREKVDNRDRAELTPEELLQRLTEGGRILPREEIVIPIEDFILNGELAYNVPMMPNDLVFIPAAGTVIVHGRARVPGVVFLGPSIRTLVACITEAGGMRYSAASITEVVRTYPDGHQESFYFNIREMRRRKVQDFLMQDGDQVFLYVHPMRDFLEALGSVFRATASTGVNATYAPM